jgi:Cu(I)/Ag(I) efflux system membrane fusion protein
MRKLILGVAAILLVVAGNACSKTSSDQKEKVVSTKVSSKTDSTLLVQGSCGMCKSRIEETAKSVKGVISAAWDSETKKLAYSYDAAKTSPDVVSKAIAKVGHDTEKDKASDDVYKTLPGCCQYRQ